MKRPFLTAMNLGAGCRNRTCFVSLKRRVHSHICQSRKIQFFSSSRATRGNSTSFDTVPGRTPRNIFDGVEASHFVRGKLRKPIPQTLVGDAGIEPAWSRLRGECISHLCQSPVINRKIGAGCWNRTSTSRLSIAGSTFELILPGAPFGS